MARKSGLGRGLDSLIPIGIMEETEEVEREVADRKAARARAANTTGKKQEPQKKGSSRSAKTQVKNQNKTLKSTKEAVSTVESEADVVLAERDNVLTEPGKGLSVIEDKVVNKNELPSGDTLVEAQNTVVEAVAANPVTEAADDTKENAVIKSSADDAMPTADTGISIIKDTPSDKSSVSPEAASVPADYGVSGNAASAPEVKAGAFSLKLTEIEPNREQPRKEFNEDALQELADSIKIHGVIQPLLVQKKGEYYEIIAGERRWRAAKIAGLKEVPVIIREYTPREVMEVSLIENIQREDLNAIEEAKAYQRLIQEFHLKQEEIAVKISKSRTAIANTMRLLKLDERVQTMLIEDEISSGHARALLPLEDGDLQYQAAQKIASESLSVRETEKLVKVLLMPPKEEVPKEEKRDDSFIYQALEEKLKTIMGTKVTIHKKDNNKGRIEIEYYSPEELERITDLIETIRQG